MDYFFNFLIAILAVIIPSFIFWLIKMKREMKDTKRIIRFLKSSNETTSYKFRSTHTIASTLHLSEDRVQRLAAKSQLIQRNKNEKQTWQLAG